MKSVRRGLALFLRGVVCWGAEIDRAEERNVEFLKACGFNAIRSVPNPASTALLDAFDQLGLLMIDDAFARGMSRRKTRAIRSFSTNGISMTSLV